MQPRSSVSICHCRRIDTIRTLLTNTETDNHGRKVNNAFRPFISFQMETTEISISKAKVIKGGAVEATYIDADGNEITMKGHNRCHNDLLVALSGLVPFSLT